jgi:hypothetical protein
MSQTAALLGLPVPFEYRGKTYQVAPFDFEAEGLFALELERRARRVIERHARELGVEQAALYADWRDACAAGRYDYPGPVAWEFLFTPDGRRLQAYLQLRRLNHRVTPELVAEIYDEPAPEAPPAPEGEPAPEAPPVPEGEPAPEPQPRPFVRLLEAMEQATANFRQARRDKRAA